MTIAEQYAAALFEVVEKNPQQGETYLKNLRAALRERGHQKLLPHIFSAYKKLLLGQERAARYREVTPQKRRTQVLIELYERLIATDPELAAEEQETA